MQTLLICPLERPAVRLLAESAPLATLPLLGQSLLQYWMAYVASAGVKQVSILASERVEQVQQLVGDGARWGVAVEVLQEFRELTPAQALMKVQKPLPGPPAQNGVVVMDHFPGLPQFPLFTNYADFFNAVSAWMPTAQTADRVGLRQLQPGVWVGLRSRVSANAQLTAPCWVGRHCGPDDPGAARVRERRGPRGRPRVRRGPIEDSASRPEEERNRGRATTEVPGPLDPRRERARQTMTRATAFGHGRPA